MSAQSAPLAVGDIDGLRPEHAHGFSAGEIRRLMDGIYARGDRLMLAFLASHMVLAIGLAFYHDTWPATIVLGGGAFLAFLVCSSVWPRTFFTRAFAGVAQQAFVALHIYQLYGQSEQHFWYFTAFTMMIVYQDWLCMWPGALLIILQHSIFAGMHNAGLPVHFFPEPYVGFTKLFYHFGIAIVHVSLCGYWAHLLREQTLGDAWKKLQLRRSQTVLEEQVDRLSDSEAALRSTSAALSESSKRQRVILDNVPDAMWVKDATGRYSAVNVAFARMFGSTPAEIEGRRDVDLLSPEQVARSLNHSRLAFEARAPVTLEYEFTIDGVVRVLDATISPVIDTAGGLIASTGTARDVTERRRADAARQAEELQLRDAQRLESLGLLAGGVAHEFNNLLLGIIGNADLARHETTPGSSTSDAIDGIQSSAHRAAALTRQMLAYAGKGQIEMVASNLSAVIDDVSQLLRTVVPKRATLRFRLPRDIPWVSADPAQIRQVVMNLVTNASEALTDTAGDIEVEVREEVFAESRPMGADSGTALPAGRYVVLQVSDTGHGMNEETQARIFEPFFSTKFVGRGLGLPVVQGILRGHGGAIAVESAPGNGTSFRAYFPTLAHAPKPIVRPITPTRVRANGDGQAPLILVVDDEPTVRTMARRVLEGAGFRVMTADDGIEAVECVRRDGQAIALVLLDTNMPRLDGKGALHLIRTIDPALPVVVSSGYTNEVALDSAGNDDRVEFLPKPYRSHELVDRIHRLLELPRNGT